MEKNLKKLLRVKYNNKEFQICLNHQNEYLFLEIRKDIRGNQYYDYPLFEDCIALNEFASSDYHFLETEVLNDKNKKRIKPFKHKIRTKLGYITINLLLTGIVLTATATFAVMRSPEFNTGYSISKSLFYAEKVLLNRISYEEDYSKLNIYLSEENIPVDKMHEAARGNSKLNTHELEYVEKYINEVYETYPHLDKRLFYESLSKLDISYKDLTKNYNLGNTILISKK